MAVGVAVAVSVAVAVAVAVPVAVLVGVAVGVADGPSVGVWVGINSGGIGVAVGVWDGVGVTVNVGGKTDFGSTPGGIMITPGESALGGVTITTSWTTLAVAVKVGTSARVGAGVSAVRLTKLVAEQPRERSKNTKRGGRNECRP